jgi:hypothetical protein
MAARERMEDLCSDRLLTRSRPGRLSQRRDVSDSLPGQGERLHPATSK